MISVITLTILSIAFLLISQIIKRNMKKPEDFLDGITFAISAFIVLILGG